MIRALLGFLFGKSARIFNSKGAVEHDLGEKKWQAWDEKHTANPDHDWRRHSGKSYKGKGH